MFRVTLSSPKLPKGLTVTAEATDEHHLLKVLAQLDRTGEDYERVLEMHAQLERLKEQKQDPDE